VTILAAHPGKEEAAYALWRPLGKMNKNLLIPTILLAVPNEGGASPLSTDAGTVAAAIRRMRRLF
jgi:hypothetical protein